jgi:hypothetical protein
LQLKCSGRDLLGEEGIRFPLSIKNYDDLRTEDLLVPRILVVVLVPHQISDWLRHSEEEMALRHCGYWTSLRGLQPTQNVETVTLSVPRSQRFTPESLHQIHDPDVLRALGPLDVAAYLRTNGWREVSRLGDKGAVWTRIPAEGEAFEVLLPLRRDVGDFVARMAETLRTLEAVEERSQIEILRDLSSTSADVIRIRAQQFDARDGTVPIEYGVSLVQRAREMLLAAACATVQPKSYFPTRKPAQAIEYMDHVRLGQTERGSYVVTLLSRVPPSMEPRKDGQVPLDVEDPFERQVTLTLARALSAVRDAAQEAVITGNFEPFQDAVARGVNANLCEAVAAMAGDGAEVADLEVSLTWSRVRPVEITEPRRIVLPADAIPAIEEAGRIFRASSPREEFELVGAVIGLRRDEGSDVGIVTVAARVDDNLRKVQVELAGSHYSQAIRAHKEEKLISCIGELVRDGRAHTLRNPRDFRIESEI